MTTYLFPGQGSQHVGMGEKLFDAFPQLVEAADAILGWSIRALCLQDAHRQLTQTQYTQPALYVVNALASRQRQRETGEAPAFAAGHSLGEYNALECAGVFSFEDGLRLVKRRGELMAQAAPGGMAAVIGLAGDKVGEVLRESGLATIDVANFNAPTQVVISGLREEVAGAQPFFEKAGAMFIPLNVGGAFHSRYMRPAGEAFAAFLQEFAFAAPRIPVLSNVTGVPHVPGSIAQGLAQQLTHSVRWTDSMLWLLQQGETEFVEVGPKDVLSKLMRTIRAQWKPQATAVAPAAVAASQAAAPSPALPAAPMRPAAPAVPATQVPIQVQAAGTADDRVAAWNRTHPVGTRVRARGYEEALVTRTQAMVLFGHRAAVYMQGYNGYFALDEVEAA